MGNDTAVIERAQSIALAVREACVAQDWSEAVTLLDEHWGLLLDERRDDLDSALRTIPLKAFRGNPGASAIRDLRMHTAADSVERMLGPSPAIPDAHDEEALDDLARSEIALKILSVASSRMIAYRVRGHMGRANELAMLVERLAQIADVHQPALVHERVPTALLQVGITQGLANDVGAAAVTLADAYDRSPSSRAHHVARDAAGKLALFSAIQGDYDVATRWIERHNDAPTVVGWQRSRVDLTANAAQCLIATELLDREAADAALAQMERPANSEHTWGPLVAYVTARHALVWGDRLRALELLRQAWDRFTPWLGADSTMAPLLRHAEIQLRLSIRQGHRTQQASELGVQHPLALTSQAHIALLEGRFDEAIQVAAKASATARWSRVRMESLAIQATAYLRLGRRPAAQSAYDNLVAAMTSTGGRLVALVLSSEDHAALGGKARPGRALVLDREVFASVTEPVKLTRQQRITLDRLDSGVTIREIGAELHLSYNTVKTHLRALYTRLGASSRDEALARAREEGLL